MVETATPRTSLTHPLLVPRLRVGRGVLGMTICPGKRGPSRSGAGWKRDLKVDMARIRGDRFDTVLTLMEWNEMRLYQVPHIKMAAGEAGLDWLHFPIVDRSVPSVEQAGDWREISRQVKRRLDTFGSVLVHCLGGLGRTGTVAAMIAQDMGMAPQASIEAVRETRPGAIENDLQERFVLDYPNWKSGT